MSGNGEWEQAPTHHHAHHEQHHESYASEHQREEQHAELRVDLGGQQDDGGYVPSLEQHHASYHHHVDLNQVNQHDPHYMELRKRANEAGDAMASCFHRSHEAYQEGEGDLAKELSSEGKSHEVEMEKLNKEASDWIFVKNNEVASLSDDTLEMHFVDEDGYSLIKDSHPGEIDLHGLYVHEAIMHTEQAITEARQRGDKNVDLIVGKGLHSAGGIAKIKPAIEELMQKENLSAHLDPQNAGVLIVKIDSSEVGMDSHEISRRLEKDEEMCVIM